MSMLHAHSYWRHFGDSLDEGRRLRFDTNAAEMELVPQDQPERSHFWKDLAAVMGKIKPFPLSCRRWEVIRL